MMKNTVTFDDRNSYADFGLVLTDVDIGVPEPKVEEVDVAGADGSIDLSTVLTDDIKFKKRKLTFTFEIAGDVFTFPAILSKISNYLHGRTMKVVRECDDEYYYTGRCTINQFKTDKRIGKIVIDAIVDPYKMETSPFGDEWLWNSFSFIDGVIYTSSVDVSGSKEVNLPNRRKIVSPMFTTTVNMTVTHNGKSYSLPKGKTTVLEIRLKEGDNYVTFTGTGKVTIYYDRGSL